VYVCSCYDFGGFDGKGLWVISCLLHYGYLVALGVYIGDLYHLLSSIEHFTIDLCGFN
jgi:hypothetical protein